MNFHRQRAKLLRLLHSSTLSKHPLPTSLPPSSEDSQEEGHVSDPEPPESASSSSSERVMDKSPKGSVDSDIVSLLSLINHGRFTRPHDGADEEEEEEYVTTSSCSGRVSVFAPTWPQHDLHCPMAVASTLSTSISEASIASADSKRPDRSSSQTSKRGRGGRVRWGTKSGRWIVCEHRPLTLEEFQTALMSASQTCCRCVCATLKFEPFIVAVSCRDREAAERLLTLALAAGCRESGMMASAAHSNAERAGEQRSWQVSIRCSIRMELPVIRHGRVLIDLSYMKVVVEDIRSKFISNQRRRLKLEGLLRTNMTSYQPERTRKANTFPMDVFNSFNNRLKQIQKEASFVSQQFDALDALIKNSIPRAHSQFAADMSGVDAVDQTKNAALHNESKHDKLTRVWSLLVPRKQASMVRAACRRLDYNDVVHLVHSVDHPSVVALLRSETKNCCASEWMALPLSSAGIHAIRPIFRKAQPCTELLKFLQLPNSADYSFPVVLHFAPAITKNSFTSISYPRNMMNALLSFCRLHELVLPSTISIPNKYERYGEDMVLFASNSFSSAAWTKLLADCATHQPSLESSLWSCLCKSLKCTRIGLQNHVNSNDLHRSSRARLLVGSHLCVLHREFGVTYSFDASRTMFSSGNGSEKKRLVGLVQQRDFEGECVVDLYAGIGYWAAPLLVHTKNTRIIAFEHDPLTFASLQKTLQINKIDSSRYTLHECDNRMSDARSLVCNTADRVLLGLLPSSEQGWPVALHALKPQGGVLHIHTNCLATDHREYSRKVQEQLDILISQLADPQKKMWRTTITHIEHVKSFAPHVDHIVIDFCIGATESKHTMDVPDCSLFTYKRAGVSVYHAPNENVLRDEVIMHGRPAIIKAWNIGDLEHFSLSELETAMGAPEVNVHVCPDPKGLLSFVRKNYIYKTMPFQEFVQRVSQPNDNYFISPQERLYLRSLGGDPQREVSNFERSFPSIAQYFHIPSALHSWLNGRYFSSVFRVSSADLSLWTHYDICANFLFQLHGRKRVVLFPPECAGDLHLPLVPHSSSSPIVDLYNSNQSAYPRFVRAQLQGIEVELEPGDVLFLPPFWFHNVRALEPSVCVNIFFRELARNRYQKNDVYGNRDLPAGVTAMEAAQQISGALMDLPATYRSFYTNRAIDIACDGHTPIKS